MKVKKQRSRRHNTAKNKKLRRIRNAADGVTKLWEKQMAEEYQEAFLAV